MSALELRKRRYPLDTHALMTIMGQLWLRRLLIELQKPLQNACMNASDVNFGAMRRKENYTPQELLSENYPGIRPAPGYPAQPDHTEKATLFDLLEATKRVGVKLTESFAMTPAASVNGLYLAHSEAHYFGVAKLSAIKSKIMRGEKE